MTEISCRHCNEQDCRGCNIYILEQMLEDDAFDGMFDMHCRLIPAERVRPVVHARWIGGETSADADGFPVYDTFICPECGAEWDAEEADIAFNFCPNCGAMMDGDG